ncbi:NTP transferase domain-containing protein [Paraglaciecola sp. L3A3]|uniref:phosphocholine cytidylyltransferase family protein n=1 Tax=Paraglaciecola sp. L3A3 TaxID=2686358 RepID=UPI00131AFFF2|nr:phosphocholine cytidylyltransferase family protein [Paraglaciecola sp. L3A3]
MKAIILAAGEGKRLRPLTAKTPKSLVSIWGKSLLVRQLEQLKKFGLTDITVVTGYCKEKIEKIGVDTVFNEEFDSTNMVFSLSKMLVNLQPCTEKSTLILYGDVAYSDAHLASLIDSSSDAKMVVLGNTDWLELWSQRLEDPLTDAETFQFDENLQLQDIGKVPDSLSQVQAQYMGMIKVDTLFLTTLLADYIKNCNSDKSKNMYLTDLIQQVANNHKVEVELVAGSWIEIDTIDDYNLYASKRPEDFGL